MTIQSIFVRPQPGEYRRAIENLSALRSRWSDVREEDKLPLYDILMRDAPGDAWSALINHDDDRSEGGSALYMIRNAMLSTDDRDSRVSCVRAVARMRLNLSAYFDDKIRDDLQDCWVMHRVSDRKQDEMADYRARVRELV